MIFSYRKTCKPSTDSWLSGFTSSFHMQTMFWNRSPLKMTVIKGTQSVQGACINTSAECRWDRNKSISKNKLLLKSVSWRSYELSNLRYWNHFFAITCERSIGSKSHNTLSLPCWTAKALKKRSSFKVVGDAGSSIFHYFENHNVFVNEVKQFSLHQKMHNLL